MSSRVAVFTLTRDRLDYTQRTFASMRERRPDHAYDHYVWDMGSTDGTAEWLADQQDAGRIKGWVLCGKNLGQHVGSNRAHDWLIGQGYDYLLRVDNDCEFKTDRWLKKLVRAQRALGAAAIVAPRVRGLDHPPAPIAVLQKDGLNFTFVQILGGICRLMSAKALEGFRFEERMPLAIGEAQALGEHCRTRIIPMAYVEDVVVRHMETTQGQIAADPAYHERSFYERHIPYGL